MTEWLLCVGPLKMLAISRCAYRDIRNPTGVSQSEDKYYTAYSFWLSKNGFFILDKGRCLADREHGSCSAETL